MAKSVLSGRIEVCKAIPKLNKAGCCDVIRLLQNFTELNDLNQLTIKIFMDCSNNWTIDQITPFENEITQTLSNKNYYHSHSQSHKHKSISNTGKDVEFPLLRLPTDLITQISFYLNEQDIFEFEQCCRLFYQMINNTSYLNLSKNFQDFFINSETLNQISQAQHCFFKYSKAKKVDIFSYPLDGENIENYLMELRSKWEKAMIVAKNDGWVENMFKSIEGLFIHGAAMVLLEKLPIELLFDPIESHLNKILFDHLLAGNIVAPYIDKFETKYLNFQHKLVEQGKQIRQLKVVTQEWLDHHFKGPFCILVEHLHLSSHDLDGLLIDLNESLLSPHYHQCLRQLTCDSNISFYNIKQNVKQRNDLNSNKKEKVNINIY